MNSDSAGPRSFYSAESNVLPSGRRLQVGVGQAMAHHGELLQGVFDSEDGKRQRGLITLPMASQKSTVTFWPAGTGSIETRPADRGKAARALELTLHHLGYYKPGGALTVESDIPIGHGYGSSTADVIAAIRAAAGAAGTTLCRSTVCRLAVEAEGASDAIAYGEQAVLFAHREGSVIEHFGGEYPPLFVVGMRTSGAQPVRTLDMPRARYALHEIELFRTLRGLAFQAIRQQDPDLVGRVATASARISQRHLPKPRFKEVVELAQDFGACGVQVAHSGTLMGLLFDAAKVRVAVRITEAANALRRAGFQSLVSFAVNANRTHLP